MKKFFVLFACCVFTACEIPASSDSQVRDRKIELKKSIDYNGEIASGYKIYLARANLSSKPASAGVVSIKHVDNDENASANFVSLSEKSASLPNSNFTHIGKQKYRNFKPDLSPKPVSFKSEICANNNIYNNNGTIPTTVWVDDGAHPAPITVAAKKESASPTACHCLVDTTCFTSDASQNGKEVADADIQKLKEAVGIITPAIETIFNSSSFQVCGDSDLYIVITDIDNDYTSGQATGTFAFFNPQDFFQTGKSNQGKYIYLDSYFLKTLDKKTILAFAHEFASLCCFYKTCFSGGGIAQHGQQDGNYSMPEWWVEMIAQNCEDALFSKLSYDSSFFPFSGRKTEFYSAKYPATPLAAFDKNAGSKEKLASYCAANYMLGAYIIRNADDGFAKFKAIAQSGEWGTRSIENALGIPFSEIVERIPEALIFTPAAEGIASLDEKHTFNKQVTSGDYTFPAITANAIPENRKSAGNAKLFKPYDFDIVDLGRTRGNNQIPEITIDATDACIYYKVFFVNGENRSMPHPSKLYTWEAEN